LLRTALFRMFPIFLRMSIRDWKELLDSTYSKAPDLPDAEIMTVTNEREGAFWLGGCRETLHIRRIVLLSQPSVVQRLPRSLTYLGFCLTDDSEVSRNWHIVPQYWQSIAFRNSLPATASGHDRVFRDPYRRRKRTCRP
jgi:hypothetical protein